MKILIKVTKDVLRRSAGCTAGKTIISQNCAVALALRDLFPQAQVGYPDMCFYFGQREEYILNSDVLMFIHRFDKASPEERLLFPEFSFEIEVPSAVIDKIGIGQAYKVLSESKTLELVHI